VAVQFAHRLWPRAEAPPTRGAVTGPGPGAQNRVAGGLAGGQHHRGGDACILDRGRARGTE
jgi:hypothetical protein